MSLSCFVDETGDPGLTCESSRFLILSGVLTNKPDELRRYMNNLFHNYKVSGEIKWSNLDEIQKKKILEYLKNIDVQLLADVYNKSKLVDFFRKSEALYKNALQMFIHRIQQSNKSANEIHLIIDERTKRKQYSLFFYLYTDLTDPETQEKIQCRKIIGGKEYKGPFGSLSSLIRIQYKNSRSDPGIWIADVIAGCLKELFENQNPAYLRIINTKISINYWPQQNGDYLTIPSFIKSDIIKIQPLRYLKRYF
ncbi:unnamed protein product, partial [marine sediment metagenome]